MISLILIDTRSKSLIDLNGERKYTPYNIPEKMKLEATFSKKSRYDQTKKCHLDWNRQSFIKKTIGETKYCIIIFKLSK